MTQHTIHSKFLIHWTGKDISEEANNLKEKYIERLKDILQKGLRMNPGIEKIYGKNKKWVEVKIARVCFTEVKLTQTEEHAIRYGGLGIGFHRNYVLEREGNPVLYVQNSDKGHIIENIDFLFKQIKTLSNETNKALEVICGYLKNMSGYNEEELKYYDEMEWRVVHIDGLTGPNNYIQDYDEKTDGGDKFYRLKVLPEDIKLIVFPNNLTLKTALKDKEFCSYFSAYVPNFIALKDCKNF